MANEGTDMVRILERQLDGSVEMLRQAIELCPEDIWDAGDREAPIWEHVYHALYFMNIWLKDWGRKREYPEFHVKEALALEKAPGRCISKSQLAGYLAEVAAGTEAFFAGITPESLVTESEQWGKQWTVADRILGQVRHVQHHAAYVNAILRIRGNVAVGWVGYNE